MNYLRNQKIWKTFKIRSGGKFVLELFVFEICFFIFRSICNIQEKIFIQ